MRVRSPPEEGGKKGERGKVREKRGHSFPDMPLAARWARDAERGKEGMILPRGKGKEPSSFTSFRNG